MNVGSLTTATRQRALQSTCDRLRCRPHVVVREVLCVVINNAVVSSSSSVGPSSSSPARLPSSSLVCLNCSSSSDVVRVIWIVVETGRNCSVPLMCGNVGTDAGIQKARPCPGRQTSLREIGLGHCVDSLRASLHDKVRAMQMRSSHVLGCAVVCPDLCLRLSSHLSRGC